MTDTLGSEVFFWRCHWWLLGGYRTPQKSAAAAAAAATTCSESWALLYVLLVDLFDLKNAVVFSSVRVGLQLGGVPLVTAD